MCAVFNNSFLELFDNSFVVFCIDFNLKCFNITTATVNSWIFTADSITVNGRTFPASYSLAPKGDVYVFVNLKATAEAADLPAVRLHVCANMPMHADAVAAAQAAKQAAKVEPAPVVEAAAPVADPAPVQDAPAPVTEPAPAKAAPVEKPWIGTSITGKGWSIAFDQATGRTRVTVEGTPTDAQRNAIEQAGFFWSAKMASWNKCLTCKAYRAAQTLAAALTALA